MTPRNLYIEAVAIVQEYLGPAAERFVDRIISYHLNKQPGDLSARDIPKLSEWTKVTLGLLTEDHALIDECQERLLILGRSNNKKKTA